MITKVITQTKGKGKNGYHAVMGEGSQETSSSYYRSNPMVLIHRVNESDEFRDQRVDQNLIFRPKSQSVFRHVAAAPFERPVLWRPSPISIRP